MPDQEVPLTELIAEIRHLHELMKKLLTKAHVKDYEKYANSLEALPRDYLEMLLNFLRAVRENEWMELYLIYTQPHVSEFMWEQYELYNFQGKDRLAEQIQFDKAAVEARRAFQLFRRRRNEYAKAKAKAGKKPNADGNKATVEETASGLCDRSKESGNSEVCT